MLKAFRCMVALSLSVFQILFLVIPISATDESAYSWYCIRTEGNKQPIYDSRLQFVEDHQGYYLDHKHGDNDPDKVIYLTFDAGYENGNIAKIFDVLQEEQVYGAFFILGNLIEKNPEVVLRMKQDGHFVCHHTTYHANMAGLSDKNALQKELLPLEKAYEQLTGEALRPYLRPPEGRFSEDSLRWTAELGYKTVFWSFAYADWDNSKQPSPESAKAKIFKYIHNGAVILLHPTSATNAAILKEVITELKQQGYRFGNLDELTAPSPCPRSSVETGEGNIYCKGTGQKKKIALTFDDGPHPRYTERILTVLAEYQVPATFFVIGVNAMAYPEALRKIVDSGCEIGNHTMHHAKLNVLGEDQIQREVMECEEILKELTGVTPTVLRPPGGCLSDGVRRSACSMGYDVVLWSVDTKDWLSPPAEQISQLVLKHTKAGDIILMHDYVSAQNNTCDSLKQIIPALLAQGYEFVTISELLQ